MPALQNHYAERYQKGGDDRDGVLKGESRSDRNMTRRNGTQVVHPQEMDIDRDDIQNVEDGIEKKQV
ncbi:hypothetical protein DPMN_077738 [Dreissena polymorpha]|uniref:Uncharacterized protein n=1 Tax=Dreissena polymorpha TaxID=45954 RepID=A0A9D3YL09_DREPO|nr:hypothetical protein DPMN_077738 [Dreissena polymorpha]